MICYGPRRSYISITLGLAVGVFMIYTLSGYCHLILNDDGLYEKDKAAGTEDNYNLAGASQEDPNLINYIRNYLIKPPSHRPYNLKYPQKVHFSQFGQSQYADEKYFHKMRDGFFIEAGAVDGEHFSNTLYFERELGWRGLLIEPFPSMYKTSAEEPQGLQYQRCFGHFYQSLDAVL